MTDQLRRVLPTIEQHVHLEGTIRPRTLLAIARRNRLALPADTWKAWLTRYQLWAVEAESTGPRPEAPQAARPPAATFYMCLFAYAA